MTLRERGWLALPARRRRRTPRFSRATRPPPNHRGGAMSDLIYVAVTLAVFGVIALIARGVEKL
ncbi:hypothetical protein GCM10009639_57020 [Kitasatospora putterlickiae]|uniref:Potassium-transporting ATPase n=1 Tax=Kitasatospora putterlickiae TaxID=221725 RepID=A0ABN1YEJ2_9ACTN